MNWISDILAPGNTTGWLVVAFLIVAISPIVYRLKARRMWLPYYMIASFAVTVILVSIARLTGFDQTLANMEAHIVTWLANFIGIESSTTQSGILISAEGGWSQLAVGIECSAVLEMAVLIGLVMGFPAYSLTKRVSLTTLGLLATFVLNIGRLLLIVIIIAVWDTPSAAFIAHAIIGRIVFFVGVVIIYWYLLTRTTLRFLIKEVTAR